MRALPIGSANRMPLTASFSPARAPNRCGRPRLGPLSDRALRAPACGHSERMVVWASLLSFREINGGASSILIGRADGVGGRRRPMTHGLHALHAADPTGLSVRG